MPSLFLAELLCLDSVDSQGDFKYRSIRNTDVAYARFLVKSQTLRRDLETTVAGYQVYASVMTRL